MRISEKKPFRVILSCDSEYRELEDSNFGLCISCGEETNSCEPDAAGYTCESCGSPKVFGLMHLLMNNRVVFTDDLEEG